MSKEQPTDWQAIHVAYRMGVESVRSIAATHNCTEGAIRKRAKRDEWTRDLNPKVRAKADDLVRKAEAGYALRAEYPSEQETVEATATVIAGVRLTHRADIARARSLAMRLLAELEHQTVNIDLHEHLRNLIATGSADQGADPERLRKLTEAFDRAMSLASRTKIMKELADIMRILIDKEREAFNIGDSVDERPDSACNEFVAYLARLRATDTGRLRFAPLGIDPVIA